MSLIAELEALRRHLDELADRADEALLSKYALRRPTFPTGFYWRVRWLAATVVRALQAMRLLPNAPWPPALRHARGDVSTKPLVIWALGAHRDALRQACRGFSKLQGALPGFAPVLVTDVADFAFFSRLGWLVEYVPRLSGQGVPYETSKVSFLALLYRGAPALPVVAGLEMETREQEIRAWLVRARSC